VAKNQISILNPSGTEAARFPSPATNMAQPVPFNGPFNLTFDGRGSLLVSNTGDETFDGYGPRRTPSPGGLSTSKAGWSSTSTWATPASRWHILRFPEWLTTD
jgi:hypothetical protein